MNWPEKLEAAAKEGVRAVIAATASQMGVDASKTKGMIPAIANGAFDPNTEESRRRLGELIPGATNPRFGLATEAAWKPSNMRAGDFGVIADFARWGTVAWSIQDLARMYLEAKAAGDATRWPLAWPVLAFVEDTPPIATANKRTDPVLPAVKAVKEARVTGEAPERAAGRLLGIAPEKDDLQGKLPALIEKPDGPRAPLLELTDLRGGPVVSRGPGAPLDLGLFVGALLMLPMDVRGARSRLVATAGEFQRFLYCNGWQRGRDWSKLRNAILRLGDYGIPIDNGDAYWIPASPRRVPGDDATLDSKVVIDIELPPGTGDGPVIDIGELARLRVKSGPKFRAYIAAQSVAWMPGRTRVYAPSLRRHVWAVDASRYPVLTKEDRARLAFGPNWSRQRRTTAAINAAFERVDGIDVIDKRAVDAEGRRGWRVLPKAAADAVRRGILRRPKDG